MQTTRVAFLLLSLLATLLSVPQSAVAVPAFARQLNAECSTCHAHHFAKLNAFGRSFKASGYSMTAREKLEGEDLSIAPNLNATFFLRSKYADESNARGTWGVPDEAAILIGGRLAEGVGGLVEWGGPLLGAKTSFTMDAGFARVGTTLFTTDALGAGYGFELMNTGAVRNQRPSERSSRPTLGSNSNLELADAATGLAFHAAGAEWFAAVTLFAPDSNEAGRTSMDAGTSLSNYLRAAWIPQVGGWDLGVGAGVYTGKTTVHTVDDGTGFDAYGNTPGLYDIVTSAWFIDAQAQGVVAGHDLGIYLMYATGEDPSSDPGEVHPFAGVDDTPSGFGLDAEFYMIRNLALLASLGQHDNGTSGTSAKTSTGIGLYWKIAQNITLQPMYEIYSGDQGQDSDGDDVTQLTITLEAAF